MRKIVVYGTLSILAAVFMTGCSYQTVPESEKTVSSEEQKETSEATTEDMTESNQTEEEERVLELLGEYLNLESYEEDNGTVFENRLKDPVETMTVHGQEFKIDMKWEDVLATGYQPTDPEFAEEETGALAYLCDFTNSNNDTVRLGFIGEEGQTVSEGSLYGVYAYPLENENTEFEVAGISETSTVEDIVDMLGEPFSILDPTYKDYTDCGLCYRCKDRDIEVTFYVDLESGKILSASLEGYGE